MITQFPELTADENKVIDRARECGYSEYYPCLNADEQAKNTLAGAKKFLTEIKEKFYETPEQIVEAYYNGKLKENYPVLVEAMQMISKKDFYDATSESLNSGNGSYKP